MSEAAIQSARAIFDAINSGELDVLDDLVTADFVDHGSPFPLPPGPEGYRQILGFVSGVLKLRYEIHDIFAGPDRVVVRAVGHGVAVDALHGPGTAGRPFVMETVHIYRTEGDRMAEHWGMRDEYGVRIQLGVLAPPDASALAAPAHA
ncbi:MAG TPA: ester cyclase [Nocardioides sp.]|nr:ester cyclase [Nocardioides sp.]